MPSAAMKSYESLVTFVRERPGHYFWGLAADLAIFLYTVVLGPIAVLLALITRSGRVVDDIGRLWCR